MKTVAVFGNSDSGLISRALYRVLNEKSSAALVEGSTVGAIQKNPDYLIVGACGLKKLYAENGVIIFQNNIEIPPTFELSGQFTAVVGEENATALRFLKNRGIITVTCGMSPKNTVSLSSRSDGSAAVCIGREIKGAQQGECILEFGEKYVDFSLLAVASALMLTCGYSEVYRLP